MGRSPSESVTKPDKPKPAPTAAPPASAEAKSFADSVRQRAVAQRMAQDTVTAEDAATAERESRKYTQTQYDSLVSECAVPLAVCYGPEHIRVGLTGFG